MQPLLPTIVKPSAETLLVSTQVACKICGIPMRTWRALDAACKIPRPVRIGRKLYWRRDDLHAWVAAGCPVRREFELRRGKS